MPRESCDVAQQIPSELLFVLLLNEPIENRKANLLMQISSHKYHFIVPSGRAPFQFYDSSFAQSISPNYVPIQPGLHSQRYVFS